jgi:hypothetical protein
MAKTIAQGFDLLKKNLEITELQEKTISDRQVAIRKAIAAEFEVLDSFLMGSYARSTMIAPLKDADVDIFFVLDAKYYAQYGPQALLAQVSRILTKYYSRVTDINPDGQAVTVTFADFKIDVVPGFYRKGGGYLIPDAKRGVWIHTDPKKHIELWTESNKAHKGEFVPVVKMIKGWNKSHGKLISSFHLECMVRKVLWGVGVSTYPATTRFIFEKLIARILQAEEDPAGYGADVSVYLTAQMRQRISSECSKAYDQSREAERLEAAGLTSRAFDEWRKVFGDYFPAY